MAATLQIRSWKHGWPLVKPCVRAQNSRPRFPVHYIVLGAGTIRPLLIFPKGECSETLLVVFVATMVFRVSKSRRSGRYNRDTLIHRYGCNDDETRGRRTARP